MTTVQSADGVTTAPDQALGDIAAYVLDYNIESEQAFHTARTCLTDTLACGLDALDFPGCTRLLGPAVPGTLVPYGARIPGTRHELDPATATFGFGCMIRWLDYNDTFAAATGGHPSDNLAPILMTADHLSRQRAASGREPLVVRDVLDLLIRAYEIQGCLSLENNVPSAGVDHNLMVRVATAAVVTRMLGGSHEQIISAVSNAWIDSSLVLYRLPPNTGSRKNWACADASSQAVRLALMAMKGEEGYPAVLSARRHGFCDAHLGGKPLTFQRPYAEYVIQNSIFKFVTAGMHGQSAIECALRLHQSVASRLDEVARIEITVHRDTMQIMHYSGPLRNPSARDHCVEYVVAVGLIHGRITPHDFEDDFASDPRIDGLRARMVIKVDARYTRDFDDPAKRASTAAVQVWFTDGASTPKVKVEYPLGHHRRRTEAIAALRAKFEYSLSRRFSREQQQKILALCDDGDKLDRTPVDDFVGMLVA